MKITLYEEVDFRQHVLYFWNHDLLDKFSSEEHEKLSQEQHEKLCLRLEYEAQLVAKLKLAKKLKDLNRADDISKIKRVTVPVQTRADRQLGMGGEPAGEHMGYMIDRFEVEIETDLT